MANGFYRMMSLQEVDSFIQKEKHLPGIKSASEYQQLGTVNIGELQMLLLQKIEELTLYNIQLQKDVLELKNQINIIKE